MLNSGYCRGCRGACNDRYCVPEGVFTLDRRPHSTSCPSPRQIAVRVDFSSSQNYKVRLLGRTGADEDLLSPSPQEWFHSHDSQLLTARGNERGSSPQELSCGERQTS
jgi:hypothetical protein